MHMVWRWLVVLFKQSQVLYFHPVTPSGLISSAVHFSREVGKEPCQVDKGRLHNTDQIGSFVMTGWATFIGMTGHQRKKQIGKLSSRRKMQKQTLDTQYNRKTAKTKSKLRTDLLNPPLHVYNVPTCILWTVQSWSSDQVKVAKEEFFDWQIDGKQCVA